MGWNTYILALKNELERAVQLRKKIFDNGFSDKIEILNAIDGRELSAIEYFNNIKNLFGQRREILSPGELGCTLSHIFALNEIIESNKPGLILENDVTPVGDYASLMDFLCKSTSPDIIIFCSSAWAEHAYLRARKKQYNSNYNLYALEPAPRMFYAAAYAVNPLAAQLLIDSHISGPYKADDWMHLLKNNNVNLFFKNVFFHSDEPNPLMEVERRHLYGSVIDFVLEKKIKELSLRVPLLQVLFNRLRHLTSVLLRRFLKLVLRNRLN